MRNSRVAGIIAGLAILAAAVTVVCSLNEGPPSFNPKPHEAVGWVMARQALGFLKPGGQITVISRDTSVFKQPAIDCQLASFQRTLQAAHTEPAVVQALQVDPLRSVEVPAGDFYEYIRKASTGSVIVSFMGPPLLTEAQRGQLGAIKPKIVAFCTGNLPDPAYLKVLFDQGLLHAAVVGRGNSPLPSTPPKDPQGWFDRFFLAVTASNAATLAALDSQLRPTQ
jgi:hypothetical protein